MKISHSYILCGLLFFSLAGCSHTSESDQMNQMNDLDDSGLSTKEGPTSHSPDVAESAVPGADLKELKLSKRKLHIFLHNHAKKVDIERKVSPASFTPLLAETLAQLKTIPPSERSNLDKAILTLAAFELATTNFVAPPAAQPLEENDVYNYDEAAIGQGSEPEAATQNTPGKNQDEQGLNEQDLDEQDLDEQKDEDLFKAADQFPNDSLDAVSENLAISVPENLRNQKLLQFPYVCEFIKLSLAKSNVSDELKGEILAAIREIAEPWYNLYVSLDRGLEEGFPSDRIDQQPSPYEPPMQSEPAVAFQGGDFADAEDRVKKAERLANKKLHADAIKLLDQISGQSPYAPTRDQLIVKYSNEAVKDLRRKAARAFQNSQPVTNVSVKLDYLREAEEYLIRAYEDFPKANQLDKVRENLSVIQERIANLEEQIDL